MPHFTWTLDDLPQFTWIRSFAPLFIFLLMICPFQLLKSFSNFYPFFPCVKTQLPLWLIYNSSIIFSAFGLVLVPSTSSLFSGPHYSLVQHLSPVLHSPIIIPQEANGGGRRRHLDPHLGSSGPAQQLPLQIVGPVHGGSSCSSSARRGGSRCSSAARRPGAAAPTAGRRPGEAAPAAAPRPWEAAPVAARRSTAVNPAAARRTGGYPGLPLQLGAAEGALVAGPGLL